MTWQEHSPHKATGENNPFYTYTLMNKDGESYYAAFIVHNDNGYQATVPVPYISPAPRGYEKAAKPYHYTHDTLQDAKDWCIAELWKRRLDQ
jgi:hypothetical protein